MTRYFLFIMITLFCLACSDGTIYTPKPRSFPKITYPERTFVDFTNDDCSFSFRIPGYYEVKQVQQSEKGAPQHDCWFDLYVEEFDCNLHCTYLEVGKEKSFDEIKTGAFKMTDWHNKRATYIDEIVLTSRYGARGVAAEIEGPVASHYQFFLTDSEQKHFFNAALYFNSEAKPDSLRPMLDFIKQDLDSLIFSFKWD